MDAGNGTWKSVFVGTSLDGFIARKDHDLAWLTGGSEASPEEYGFPAFMARIDALVMGRNTYDVVVRFPEWYYGDKPVFVLTHRPLDPPPKGAHVEAIQGTPSEIVHKLAVRGFKRLYIDGGTTIQQFLAAGHIDEIIVSRLPVLIGEGIPLFGPLPHDVHLAHVNTHVFTGGMVQSTYRVKPTAGSS